MADDPPHSLNRPGRRLAGALALVLVAACSSSATTKASASATTTASVQGGPAATATTATGAPAASTAAAAPAAQAAVNLSATEKIKAALADYKTGYQITSTVSVDGAEATKLQGRHVGGSSSFVITSNGISIDEVITKDGVWTRPAGKDWAKVDSPQGNDSLAALLAPKTASEGPGPGQFHAVYDATAFGLPTGDLMVALTVADGRVTNVHYEASSGGKTSVSDATFGALTDNTPITAPA